jgi:hypothetical protein
MLTALDPFPAPPGKWADTVVFLRYRPMLLLCLFSVVAGTGLETRLGAAVLTQDALFAARARRPCRGRDRNRGASQGHQDTSNDGHRLTHARLFYLEQNAPTSSVAVPADLQGIAQVRTF